MTRRSKSALERRMAANKNAHRFASAVKGVATVGAGRLRYSRLAGCMPEEARAEFERERAKAAHCPEHGELRDPAVMLVSNEIGEQRAAFICPWCSGAEILEAWEQEGAS